MDSTLTGNAASGNGGAIDNAGTLSISGSTLSGNQAGGSGGAVYNQLGATATVTTSTLDGNTTTGSGNTGGGGIENEGTLTVADSIFSHNSSYTGGGPDNLAPRDGQPTDSTFYANNASQIRRRPSVTWGLTLQDMLPSLPTRPRQAVPACTTTSMGELTVLGSIIAGGNSA